MRWADLAVNLTYLCAPALWALWIMLTPRPKESHR